MFGAEQASTMRFFAGSSRDVCLVALLSVPQMRPSQHETRALDAGCVIASELNEVALGLTRARGPEVGPCATHGFGSDPRSTPRSERHLRHRLDLRPHSRGGDGVSGVPALSFRIFLAGREQKYRIGIRSEGNAENADPRQRQVFQPSAERLAARWRASASSAYNRRRRLRRSLSGRLRASAEPAHYRSLTRFPKGPPPGAFGRDAAPRDARLRRHVFLVVSREQPRFSFLSHRESARSGCGARGG